ncbi:MAG: hypothetical protein CYPHOPRED_004288, partial [Cyphobasidiales sp. Tagirdzhanova-0007]
NQFPWASAGTLVPLLLGIAFLPVFLFVEKKFVSHSILPFELFNRTTLMGYLTTFLHNVVVIAVIYYLPAWFIAVKGRSALQAGIDILPIAFLIAPAAIACGITVAVTQKYLPQNVIGWLFSIVGCGVLVILRDGSSVAMGLGLQAPVGIGLGILYSSTCFAVLAPLDKEHNAQAMSFHAFSKSFGQVFGITIGSLVLNNQLAKKLPTEYLTALPGGPSSAYSAIPNISGLQEPLRTVVRVGFADSIRVVFIVCIGICGLGLICSLFIKALTLHADTDEAWGMDETEKEKEKTKKTADVAV